MARNLTAPAVQLAVTAPCFNVAADNSKTIPDKNLFGESNPNSF
jgi:hypothetical protein